MKVILSIFFLGALVSCSLPKRYHRQRAEKGNMHSFVYFKTVTVQNDPYKLLIKSKIGDSFDSVKIAYWGGQTEVTNEQYWEYLSHLRKTDTALFKARKPKTENWRTYSEDIRFADSLSNHYDDIQQFGDFPVVNITPEDAKGYVYWLNSIEPDSLVFYRLFKEFEWLEFFNDHEEIDSSFAWGGYYWRSSNHAPLANYAEFDQNQIRYNHLSDDIEFENSDSIGYQSYVNGPMSVWSFNPNCWGAYNLSGNVAELTTEFYELDGNWFGNTHGGSWHSPVFYLRKFPSETYLLPSPFVGFRVLKIQVLLDE